MESSQDYEETIKGPLSLFMLLAKDVVGICKSINSTPAREDVTFLDVNIFCLVRWDLSSVGFLNILLLKVLFGFGTIFSSVRPSISITTLLCLVVNITSRITIVNNRLWT